MNSPLRDPCHCGGPITRRGFIKTVASGVAVSTAASSLPLLDSAVAGPTKTSKSETLVTSLYKSLHEEQRKALCFPFDHPLRSKVDNNWQITKLTIAESFDKDEQALLREIFRSLHSPEY